MTRHLSLCLSLAAFALPGVGQGLTRQNLASILGFENGTPGQYPAGWGRSGTDANGTVVTDDQVFHSGKYSARMERPVTANSQGFSGVIAGIPLDFAGKTVQWRGWVKTENVVGAAAIWIREDGAGTATNLAFATTQGLNVRGTTDWTQYSVTLPVLLDGKQLVFGSFVLGTGKVWVYDLEMLVDGVPVANTPPRNPTIFDTDHEFDNGTGISFTTISQSQIVNAATLAQIRAC